MNLKPGHIGILVVLLLAFIFTGWVFGAAMTKSSCQAEAVKTGHAQYKVMDEYGKVAFEWLPNHGPEKPMPPK